MTTQRRLPDRARRAIRASLPGALLLAGLAVGCATVEGPRAPAPEEVRPGGPRRTDPLAVGEKVPDFRAPGLDGGMVRWQDRDGAPTVLVVWASWCPHCGRLLPALQQVARDYPAVRLLSVTTAIGRRGGPSPSEFVALHRVAFPVALDDAESSVARALGVARYPTVYWVERGGTVRGVSEGEATEAELRRAFDALLAGL